MVGAVILRISDLLVQLVLIWLGLAIIGSDDDSAIIDLLGWWCLVGTLYWVASVTAVGISLRRGPERSVKWLQHLDRHRIAGIVSTTTTFVTSLVGLVAVAEILVLRDDPDWAGWVEPVAVYAMLLSWALFHWGFARIYDRHYRRSEVAPLLFPGTDSPRVVDFVYFSFTNATAFSVSDVQVMTSRMRWTVVWHTTFSFFLNALIIVFAFSTIINGI